jgi:hypothetical protein
VAGQREVRDERKSKRAKKAKTVTRVTIFFLVLSICATSVLAQELRLEGRFEYRTDEESRDVLGEQVCFFPERSTAGFVPRDKSDRRLVWFCFSNTSDAKRMLQIPSLLPAKSCGYAGNAAITIADYRLYRGEGDGNDVALLKKAALVSKGVSIECTQ